MLILERTGGPIAGDPYRIDTGSRVILDPMDLLYREGDMVCVGVVEESSEKVATYETDIPARILNDMNGWRPCRQTD